MEKFEDLQQEFNKRIASFYAKDILIEYHNSKEYE